MIWPVLPKKSDEMRAQLGLPPVAPTIGADRWPVGPRTRTPGESLALAAPLFPTLDAPTGRALVESLTPKVPAAPATDATAGTAESTADATAATERATRPTRRSPWRRSRTTSSPRSTSASASSVPASASRRRTSSCACPSTSARRPREQSSRGSRSRFGRALVGRRVVVVANLAPRDFGKGLVSHGMLLATGPSDHLMLATVDGDVPAGAKLK